MQKESTYTAADQSCLREWGLLEHEEQTAIRIEYGRYLDSLPPTCSMETKIERFRSWLRQEKGIDFKI
jgi:hypothetical protein